MDDDKIITNFTLTVSRDLLKILEDGPKLKHSSLNIAIKMLLEIIMDCDDDEVKFIVKKCLCCISRIATSSQLTRIACGIQKYLPLATSTADQIHTLGLLYAVLKQFRVVIEKMAAEKSEAVKPKPGETIIVIDFSTKTPQDLKVDDPHAAVTETKEALTADVLKMDPAEKEEAAELEEFEEAHAASGGGRGGSDGGRGGDGPRTKRGGGR